MPLTVVMYHYVRRLAESRYPEIKGLERELFIEQLRYLKRFYTPVSGSDVIEALKGSTALPSNAVLLTFDDGYLDHFTTVFPLLLREKMSGIFFPPASCVLDGKLLDVNKIHYTLASVPDKSKLVAAIDSAVLELQTEYDLDTPVTYKARYAIASRFDTAEVIYIKRMLQVGLPLHVREMIADRLFAQFVSIDQRAFAREVYMDLDQIRCMVHSGMMVGSHGFNHVWLDQLGPQEQEKEIDGSLAFLQQVGVPTQDWIMCYPYGAWSQSLVSLLRARGCAMGFTTEVSLANLDACDPLLLPRLDTNDLPKSASATPTEWTLRQ